MKLLKMFFALSVMIITFNSCQKDESATVFDEIALSQQETQATEILTDVDLLVDEAIDLRFLQLKSASIDGSYLTDCPVVTVIKDSNPQVMTLDFGAACTGKDGKVRSGKVIVTSTSFKTFPSVRTKSFDNFFVDGRKLEGTVVKTISVDQQNNIRIAQLQENVTITFPDNGGTAKRVANLTRQYMRNALDNKQDNQTTSWGTVEFTRVSGAKLTKTIEEANPLVFKMACHQIVSGIVTFTTVDKGSWTINYGDGECDNKATLTKGDKTKEIKIR